MLTSKQKDKIDEKKAALAPALLRDKDTNYTEGYFFITLNTRDEVPVLGRVEGRVGVPMGQTNAPHVKYSELGEKVLEVWKSIPQYHPQVEVIAAEVMPEHFHGLLHLKSGVQEHLGRVVNGFMIGCTHAYWDILGIAWRDMQRDEYMGNSAIARKTALEWQNCDHTHSYRGPALFVHGYNEVLPITEEEIQTKIDYIKHQAERRLIRGVNIPCFHVNRKQRSANWSKEAALAAIERDACFGEDAIACQNKQEKVAERLLEGLDWLGEKQLLMNEKKLPLVCHRADIHLFEQQREAVLTAAREGAVIVSAFISTKEREIRDTLFMEQLPVVEIVNNGFSERYKPQGKAFYACAEKKLVQITPWKYQYERDNKISREMCLVMNKLSITICQRKDDWWKK